MRKYHINPENGKIYGCNATVRDCKYTVDGHMPEHYSTIKEAREAVEKQYANKTLTTVQKRAEIVPATEEEKKRRLEQKIDEMIDDLNREERQELLAHIVGLKREQKKKEFDKKINQVMNDDEYYGTVFQHKGKVVDQERMSKEEYRKIQDEKRRKRKEELKKKEAEAKAKKPEREDDKTRRTNLQRYISQKANSIEDLENLTAKEDELKGDKKRIREYLDILQRKSYTASAIEGCSVRIRDNSTKENRYSAQLGVEDADMFERDTYQDEYKKLLELRAEMRKRIKRNPFSAIKRISADMNGVLTKEQSMVREINDRIGKVIDHSYRWRISKDQKAEWAQFETSIDHLLDEDEK